MSTAVFVGMFGESIRITTPITWTGYTVTVEVERPDRTTFTRTGTIVSGTPTSVDFTPQAGDLNQEGEYKAWVVGVVGSSQKNVSGIALLPVIRRGAGVTP